MQREPVILVNCSASWHAQVPAFHKVPKFKVKGILHQKIFYRLNLIFWIVMGCGIADFDRRGL